MKNPINSKIDENSYKTNVYIKFCKFFNYGTTKFDIDSLPIVSYKIDGEQLQDCIIDIPKEADFVEIWSEVSAKSEDGSLTYKSKPINKQTYDFNRYGDKKSQLERITNFFQDYAKTIPYVSGTAETPKKQHCIGYSTISHPDFAGIYDRIQHPTDASLSNVKLVNNEINGRPECRFEIFSQYVSSVGSQKEQIYLYSVPFNVHTYYIGSLEVDAKRNESIIKTAGGNIVVSPEDLKNIAVISPSNINEYGRIEEGGLDLG